MQKYILFLNVMPFGLVTAGYISSKVFGEVVKYLRSEDIRKRIVLDNDFGGSNNCEFCQKVVSLLNQLEKLCFKLLVHERCLVSM